MADRRECVDGHNLVEIPDAGIGDNHLGGPYFHWRADGDFVVLDARDGNVLYRFNTGGPVTAGIITYAVAGKQYIGVMSGAAIRFWRTPPASSTVIIFSLP